MTETSSPIANHRRIVIVVPDERFPEPIEYIRRIIIDIAFDNGFASTEVSGARQIGPPTRDDSARTNTFVFDFDPRHFSDVLGMILQWDFIWD